MSLPLKLLSPSKSSKINWLPPCCSAHEQKPINHYALLSINDTVTNSGLNVAFVAIAGEPKMYLEAMQSTNLKK